MNYVKYFFLLVICQSCIQLNANNDKKLDGAVINITESNEGLDLGEPYIISRVGLVSHKDDELLTPFGVFEGANQKDFMDALPLLMIAHPQDSTGIVYYDISNSKGFRYVRYVGPSNYTSHISELEFYGHPGKGDDSHLYQITNLPTVNVHTLDAENPYDKVHQIECLISIISGSEPAVMLQSGTIRLRGNGSAEYPKQPYRIKFREKQQVLDAPAIAKKWTLINNYADKTLLRNSLAFEISKKIKMPYTPYGAFVDVLLNGDYKGVYLLCDQVQVHKGRVDITKMTQDDNEGEALSGGYHFEIDAYARFESSWFQSADGKPVTIHSPEEDLITDAQRYYIESYFNMMEHEWRRYLDLNTFIRHFLVGELSGNTDTYWSVHMYKERGNDTTFVGPVWDFDLAFENDKRTYPINEKSDFIFRSGGSCANNMKGFVSDVIDDGEVRQMITNIWKEVRNNGLNEEYLISKVDSLKRELAMAQELNFTRWPIMLSQVDKEPVIWGSYNEEVESVKRFITDRLLWMDKALSHNNTPNAITEVGNVEFQSVQIYSISGVYCGNDVNKVNPGIYIIKQGEYRRKVLLK